MLMGTNLSLKEAIEQLYEVFSNYPLADHIDGCPCCVSNRDHALIHSVPLRALSAEDLYIYSINAIWTWGNSQDYRHFLPRLFELMAQNPYSLRAYGQLPYADWHSWPDREQDAIRAYIMAVWLDMLDTHPVEDKWLWNHEAEDYLCTISSVGEDLEPYLTIWAEGDLTYKHDHFEAMINRFDDPRHRRISLNGAWDPKTYDQVVQWLTSNATLAKMIANIT